MAATMTMILAMTIVKTEPAIVTVIIIFFVFSPRRQGRGAILQDPAELSDDLAFHYFLSWAALYVPYI